jgi:hypothetical protein
LVKTPAVSQTRESVKEYFTVIKQHDLSEAEVLNVLNIRPASEVEIYHVCITTMFFSFISCLSNLLDVILALYFLKLSPHFSQYFFSIICV